MDLKKIFLPGILMVVLLTAGCAGPHDNSAQPGASQTGVIVPAMVGTGLSKSAPASIDEPIAFTERANDTGQGYADYSARLTLLEVLRGNAAYDKIKQSYPYNLINIQQDREFMVTRFKYELTDTSVAGASRLVNRDSFAVYRDGKFDAEDNRYIIGATPDFYGRVIKGGSVDGWIAFTVPKDASWPLIVYGSTNAGSGGIWFKTH
jgi:hypothetical protein